MRTEMDIYNRELNIQLSAELLKFDQCGPMRRALINSLVVVDSGPPLSAAF